MSGTTTINLLQALHAALPGVANAPRIDQYPTQINSADVPFVLTWGGEATWQRKGGFGALNREDRTYRILVFGEALAQNTIPNRAVDLENLRVVFIQTYLLTDNIALNDPAPAALNGSNPQIVISQETGPFSDSGIRPDMEFGGVPYHGFELQIKIRELW